MISSSVVSTIRPVSVSVAGLSIDEAAAAALADESTPYSSAASPARRWRTASSFHSRLCRSAYSRCRAWAYACTRGVNHVRREHLPANGSYVSMAAASAWQVRHGFDATCCYLERLVDSRDVLAHRRVLAHLVQRISEQKVAVQASSLRRDELRESARARRRGQERRQRQGDGGGRRGGGRSVQRAGEAPKVLEAPSGHYLSHQLVALAARGVDLRDKQAKDDTHRGEVGAQSLVDDAAQLWRTGDRAGSLSER